MVTFDRVIVHRHVAQDAEVTDRQHRDLGIGDILQRGESAFTQRGSFYHVVPG